MIEITISNGMIAKIDDEDAHLAKFRWSASVHRKNGKERVYAVRQSGRKRFALHREIMLNLSEKDIQRTVCDLLRAEGWRVFELEQQWSDKKMKTVGEKGMPDVLAIRYRIAKNLSDTGKPLYAEVLWCEMKRTRRGRATKPTAHQLRWHEAERARGALTLIAGVDFPATIEGFREWYANSGLERR